MEPLNLGLLIGTGALLNEVQSALYSLPVQAVLDEREFRDWSVFAEKLERVQPDVVLLAYDLIATPLEQVVRQIKATESAPRVILVHSAMDPGILLGAMRAGADEFLYPPLGDDLRHALERMAGARAQQRAGTKPRGKVLGFLSAKGGCGCTTICCHVALALHVQTRLQVLLADFDLEAGIAGFLMKTQSRYSVLDAAENADRLDANFWKALVSNGHPGVEVISAPEGPVRPGQRALDGFHSLVLFIRSAYDYSVLDLGRGFLPAAMSVLGELDELYLVSTVDVPALQQARRVVQHFADAELPIARLRLLLNRMPRRADITAEEVQRMLEVPVFATLPDDAAALYEAYSERSLLAPNSDLGKHFTRVAARIAGTEGKAKKRRLFGRQ